ncbi:MAG: hypothetical protein WC969_12800 [Elusimicrobiota bacterium]
MTSIFADFLLEPVRAARRVRERTPLGSALLAFIFAGCSLAAADAVLGRGTGFGGLAFALALACVLRLTTGVVMTAAVHLSAEALGGQGRAGPLFALMGFSDLGWALLPPAALIARALGRGAWTGVVLAAAAGLVVLALRARSVRLHYGFSRARAWTAVGLPYLAAAGLALLALGFAVWGTVHQLVKVFA